MSGIDDISERNEVAGSKESDVFESMGMLEATIPSLNIKDKPLSPAGFEEYFVGLNKASVLKHMEGWKLLKGNTGKMDFEAKHPGISVQQAVAYAIAEIGNDVFRGLGIEEHWGDRDTFIKKLEEGTLPVNLGNGLNAGFEKWKGILQALQYNDPEYVKFREKIHTEPPKPAKDFTTNVPFKSTEYLGYKLMATFNSITKRSEHTPRA